MQELALPLCWMVEYASAVGRNDIVELLFEDFTTKDWNVEPETLIPVKNAKGRFIVRTLIENIKEQKFPKLIREFDMFAELLRSYGSSGTVSQTAKIVIAMQKQTYMYYINNIAQLEDPGVSELKKSFRKVLMYHETMKKRFVARKKNLEEQGENISLIEAKINLEEEKLLTKMQEFVDNYDPAIEESDVLLRRWCRNYSCEKFKKMIISFLQEINDNMPMTVLEYFSTTWKQKYNVENNGLTRNDICQQYQPEELNNIHRLYDRDVQKFLSGNEMENYFPSPFVNMIANQTSEESPVSNVQQTTNNPPTVNITDTQETRERQNIQESRNQETVPRPTYQRDVSKSPRRVVRGSEPQEERDPLHDLLEMSDDDERHSPISQIPSQHISRTPMVATELRESINDLARLRGTDPLHKAQEESRVAQKRSRPISSPPARKIQKTSNSSKNLSTLEWNSDTDDENDELDNTVQEPEFRDPKPAPELQQIPPRAIVQPPSNRTRNPDAPVGKKGRWSDREVDQLIEGLRLFGAGNWRLILNHFNFEGRTGVNLKDKYRNLLRYYTKEELLSKPTTTQTT